MQSDATVSEADCSAIMGQLSAATGILSMVALRISLDPTLNTQSFVWNQGSGCLRIQPTCFTQVLATPDGQQRSGTFCGYGAAYPA
jgi:hypothetical protein